jgi:hypothetical protein
VRTLASTVAQLKAELAAKKALETAERNQAASGGKSGSIIKRQDDCLAGETGWDTGAIWVTVRKGSGAGFDEQRIRMPVVAAGKLDYFIATCETTGESHGGHRGLGAAAGHADFFN